MMESRGPSDNKVVEMVKGIEVLSCKTVRFRIIGRKEKRGLFDVKCLKRISRSLIDPMRNKNIEEKRENKITLI